MKMIQKEKTLQIAADKADMDVKTARKYRDNRQLPSQCKPDRHWRTRPDVFEDVWDWTAEQLEENPGLEAKTLFEAIQRDYPGKFQDGQLRTYQRRLSEWRAIFGPEREVFFAQIHKPGQLCQSDFTHMSNLGVTINGILFPHMIYHFVLTYSNWETCTICFSESFESLSEGLQNALWELGGVPFRHRTDSLSTAVINTVNPKEFTGRYKALTNHYKLEAQKTQANHPNENGDVEQRHYRFSRAVEQALMLRGSPDFSSREEYEEFLKKLLRQLNAGREKRFLEELKVLRRLPQKRRDDFTEFKVKVRPGSTINVCKNKYSVNSRLIGRTVKVNVYAEKIEVRYAQRKIDTVKRLRGSGKHLINYRHVIRSLVRKPGAFENYRYRDDMFPTIRFRMAYDALSERMSSRKADREYLRILELAANESEVGVDDAIRLLLDEDGAISFDAVNKIVMSGQKPSSPTEISIDDVDITSYDGLLDERGLAS